jgi:hypothetical protein
MLRFKMWILSTEPGTADAALLAFIGILAVICVL